LLGSRPRWLRVGEVHNVIRLCHLGAGVAEHPPPARRRVGEALGLAALAASQPLILADRHDIDHVFRIADTDSSVSPHRTHLPITHSAYSQCVWLAFS